MKKKNNANNTNPIILIGSSLEETYKTSPAELKKVISISAGIEPSNIRAYLNPRRNISKNSLRKITKGLDVYAVLQFIPSRNIKSELLEYEEDKGVVYVNDYEDFLELLQSSIDSTKYDNSEDHLLDKKLLSGIEVLLDAIQSAKKNNLSEDTIKQKFCDAISELAHSLSDSK